MRDSKKIAGFRFGIPKYREQGSYRMDGGAGAVRDGADPLAATVPLLRALPAQALLFRPDGTVAAGSAALEDLPGIPVEGLTTSDLAALLHLRFPTGRALHFADFLRDLGDQPGPAVAVDLRDRSGRFRAMIASGSAVRSGGETIGFVVLFSEVTGLLEANGTAQRARKLE